MLFKRQILQKCLVCLLILLNNCAVRMESNLKGNELSCKTDFVKCYGKIR